MGFIDSFNTTIDSVILKSVSQGSGAVSGYVVPALWVMFALSLLIYNYMVFKGKVQSDFAGMFGKFFMGLVIISFTSIQLSGSTCRSNSFNYSCGVVNVALGMQSGLTTAMMKSQSVQGVSGATSTSPLGALYDKVQSLVSSAFESINHLDTYGLTGIPKFGATMMLGQAGVYFLIGGVVLAIVALINLTYSKLGMALTLIVGPFFVGILLIEAVRGWFFSWLNTILYFVMLSVLTAAYVGIFVTLADQVLSNQIGGIQAMAAVTSAPTPTAAYQVFVVKEAQITAFYYASIDFGIIAFVLFLVGYELRSLASSMTGGSGGGAATGLRAIGGAVKGIAKALV